MAYGEASQYIWTAALKLLLGCEATFESGGWRVGCQASAYTVPYGYLKPC